MYGFEVWGLVVCKVTGMCTAGFLGMQEQLLILPIKDWASCPPPIGCSSPQAQKITVCNGLWQGMGIAWWAIRDALGA